MREKYQSVIAVDGPRISVIGVGGAGGNAVDNMLRLGLEGVNFLVCNTDAQALTQALCPSEKRICMGINVTKGLGAGLLRKKGAQLQKKVLTKLCKK